MVSLSTVYIISVVLTSIAGMGSAFLGNKVTGGALQTPIVEDLPLEPELPPQPSIEQIEPVAPLEEA